jgi:heme/copper-type cytochrome/quinol oxidase subunit 4
MWPDINKVNELMFTEDTRESDVMLVYLDLPYVHSYQQPVGDEFFNALADADIDIFENKSIQALIDYKWPLAREYTVKMLFIPFILFHLNFIIYSNVFNGQYQYTDNSWYIGHDALAALNYAFSLYFLQNEMRQLVSSKWEYFTSFWNYIDFFPPILIIIVTSLKLNIYYNSDYQGTYFLYTLHAFACMGMWLKLLYFLTIFKQTSYLVRTLTDVLWEMKTFLFILFVVYFAFGDALLRYS